MGAGGAPRTAIALGQGDRKQAEKIISNSFTMLLLFAVVLTIGFYAGAPVLLRLFGASDATLPYALGFPVEEEFRFIPAGVDMHGRYLALAFRPVPVRQEMCIRDRACSETASAQSRSQ